MPKSVKSPVKCVVRTAAFEIVVTSEFCNPIAKSKEYAKIFGDIKMIFCPNTATDIKIKLSAMTGIR